MDTPRKRRGVTRRRLVVLAAVGACASLVLLQLPAANALEVTEVYESVEGNATWYDSLGSPYGGCGMPQDALETQNFIALNVFNTPKDYTMYNRPVAAGDPKLGMWNNGHNCGRWVEVEISDYCTGTNDGAANSSFCRNGNWVKDEYNGAKLKMMVADSCADPNGWCRDDPYHIDLVKSSLSKFEKADGSLTTGMLPDHWNNRHVKWKFIESPNYTGDIQIGFLQSAQPWWVAISVSHLANGIHGVQYLQGDTWKDAKMNGDMGQSFIIEGLSAGGSSFKIRVLDVNDQLINNGRVYSFSFPSSCTNQCSGAYTKATYTTEGSSASPDTTTSPSDPGTSPSASESSAESESPSSTSSGPTASVCSASYQTSNSWQGGYQGQVTVRAGDAAINGWTVSWTLASGETVSQAWNGQLATTGSTVTVTNPSWGGALAANASTTFGFIASGAPSTPTLTCTSP